MSTDDPRRVTELLWRHRLGDVAPPPGPSGVGVDELVDAAIAIARDGGLGAVTLRRTADAVGVSPMTPYRYVPSRAALVQLMAGRAYDAMRPRAPADDGWRARLAALLHDAHDLYAGEPWLLEIAEAAPPLGPGWLAKYDREVAVIEELALDPGTVDAIATMLDAAARTAARPTTWSTDGSADLERWDAVHAVLRRATDPTEFPAADRIGTALGEQSGSPVDGLRLLEGVTSVLVAAIERLAGLER